MKKSNFGSRRKKPSAKPPSKRGNTKGKNRRKTEPLDQNPIPSRAKVIEDLAPDPAAPIPIVYVKNRISQPRLYRKRVQDVVGARAGDLVAVYTEAEELIGYGLFNPKSEIAVRMLWYGEDVAYR